MTTCLVTGGGGFLGKALCQALLQRGYQVRALARGYYPELEAQGVQFFRSDLADPNVEFSEIFAGVDAVFHVAAKVAMWGEYEDFYKVNVLGTRRILHACRQHSIRKLIYTSSPSVVANGHNLRGVDESQTYPQKYIANYPKTKAIAEKEVLAANSDNFFTCALRPHLIWGPGDTNLLPTILKRARQGRLLRVGNGLNRVDITYIDNCVAAHLCAFDALEHTPEARGKAYFISQGEPVELWSWIDQVLKLNGLPPVKRKVSASLAYAIALLCELFAGFLRLRKEPLLTRFLVEEMSTDHFFNINRARSLLGYNPEVSTAQGMEYTFGPRTEQAEQRSVANSR